MSDVFKVVSAGRTVIEYRRLEAREDGDQSDGSSWLVVGSDEGFREHLHGTICSIGCGDPLCNKGSMMQICEHCLKCPSCKPSMDSSVQRSRDLHRYGSWWLSRILANQFVSIALTLVALTLTGIHLRRFGLKSNLQIHMHILMTVVCALYLMKSVQLNSVHRVWEERIYLICHSSFALYHVYVAAAMLTTVHTDHIEHPSLGLLSSGERTMVVLNYFVSFALVSYELWEDQPGARVGNRSCISSGGVQLLLGHVCSGVLVSLYIYWQHRAIFHFRAKAAQVGIQGLLVSATVACWANSHAENLSRDLMALVHTLIMGVFNLWRAPSLRMLNTGTCCESK